MTAHRGTAYLDGVRGWASLAVVLGHARGGFLRPSDSLWQDKIMGALGNGAMAVHVFFVLSGFVLSVSFLRSGNRRGLIGLALRRYPRLTLPILAITLIAYLLMCAGLIFNHAAAQALHSQNNLGDILQFRPSFIEALRFALFDVYFRYDFATSYNTNLWTMPIELLGSFFVFAFLALPVSRLWRNVLLAVALAVTIPIGSPYADFFVGIALAEFTLTTLAGRGLPALQIGLGVACILGALAIRHLFHESPWTSAIASGLLVALPILSSHARAFFEMRLSVWLGQISFPLYLVHALVIFSPASWLALRLLGTGLPNLVVRDIVIAATILLSLAAAHAFLPVEKLAISSARDFSEFVLGLFQRKHKSEVH